MIDHMTFRVADIARTKAFYTAALAPLGYRVTYEGHHGGNVLGMGYDDPLTGQTRTDSWFVDGPSPYQVHPVSTGCHLCWTAPTREAVDAFHGAALIAGGRDNGPPGLRAHYHPDYYGAFVIDPDGNNIEAVCHHPQL